MINNLTRWLLIITLTSLLFLTGCASHSNKLELAKESLRQGDYSTAEAEFNKHLKSKHNKLLKLLELSITSQLQENYLASLAYLEAAETLAEESYTIRFTDLVKRGTTNATFTSYKSDIIERIYINYFKMLNYIYLAEEAKTSNERQNLLDSARVEARRSLTLLDENVFIQGDYATAKDEQESLLYQLQTLFSFLNGEIIDTRKLVFRDNAFSHYMIGSLFEKLNELDAARVSYQRAAKLYEEGYTKQYELDAEMTRQAWLATIRILKRQGNTSWRRLAQQKLTAQQRKELNTPANKNSASLIVLQEVDMASPRAELNMRVSLDNNRLTLTPILLGNRNEQAYQLAWFYHLYADKSLIHLIKRINSEDYLGILTKQHKRSLKMPKAFMGLLDELQITQVLENLGVRLAVPLLYYEQQPITSSQINTTQGKSLGKLILAENISALSMARHLVNAEAELRDALIIETFRLISCLQLGIPADLCSLSLASTTAAETRHWISLPYEIRLIRLELLAGEHQLTLTSQLATGKEVKQSIQVNLQKKEVRLVRLRTFITSESKDK